MIVKDLESMGFRVFLTEEDDLKIYPSRKLTDKIRTDISSNKKQIVQSLKDREVKKKKRRDVKIRSVRRIGVGSELKDIIPNFFERKGCGCSDYAMQLDRKGIDWCETNRDKIVEHLVEKASETFIGSLSETLDRIVAKKWVNSAINNAKEKSEKALTEEKELVESGSST